MTGLAEPITLGANASDLFVGQFAAKKPILRVPKIGGKAETVVDAQSFVELISVHEGGVYFSAETTVQRVPIEGGPQVLLASGFAPAGFDVTDRFVYVADHEGGRLLQVDQGTLQAKVLGKQTLPGIYGIAQAEDIGLIYFTSVSNGLRRYHLDDDWFDSIATLSPPARIVKIFDERVYFTVPSLAHVYRVGERKELVADLATLGTNPGALESDGSFLYLTLEVPEGSGLIVRVPVSGGEVSVVADAQGPSPAGLVVDHGCVYWTERVTGSIFRARKNPFADD